MPELLTQIPQQLVDFWEGLDRGNRKKIIITSILVFISAVIAILIITAPQYKPLFSRLDHQDIGEIIEELDKLNINYKLADGGTSILVKKQQLNKSKVALAQNGYPKKGITFEDLSKSSFSTTDSERQKRYQAYKESDIERALKEIDNVRDATVMLSIPEKTAFFNSEVKGAKASVRVDSYQELTRDQVMAIQRFVAGSIEDLDSKDVTILDNNGNMLNQEDGQGFAESADKQYQLSQLVTKNVERKITELLANLADNVRVMANLELDFDTLVTSKEIYEPIVDEKGIIRSYTERKESASNDGAMGVVGLDANPPMYPNVEEEGDNTYKLSDKTVNYDINKTVTQSSKEIGKIDKESSSITVALFHNNDRTNVIENIDIPTIKGMVASATGISADKVIVENLFTSGIDPQVKSTMDLFQWLNIYGSIILLIILMGLIILSLIYKPKGQDRQNENYSSLEGLMLGTDEPIAEIDLDEKSEFKKEIDKLVDKKPELAVQMLRTWMAEDWD